MVSLTGHTKSVASAYFSPLTGNRVVTVCADDTLRYGCEKEAVFVVLSKCKCVLPKNGVWACLNRF